MKLVFCLIALVPIVVSATLTEEEKRSFIVGSVKFSVDDIKQAAFAALGSSVTESGCEHFCHGFTHGLDFGLCGRGCKGIQDYARQHG